MITPTVKNPSAQSLQIRQPFVRLKLDSNGEAVASSQVANRLYTIEPFSQITLDPIIISIGTFQMVNLLLQLGKNIYNTGRLSLYVDTIVGFSGDVPPFIKEDTYEIDPRNLL